MGSGGPVERKHAARLLDRFIIDLFQSFTRVSSSRRLQNVYFDTNTKIFLRILAGCRRVRVRGPLLQEPQSRETL